MSNKLYTLSEYIKEFPLNKRVREFWKLFKTRGSLDNRHLSFNICRDCSNYLFENKERLKFETDEESNFLCVLISFRLCEDCVERNIFEVNSYIFKYRLKPKNQANTVSIEKKTENNEEKRTATSEYIPKPKKSKKSNL